MCHYVLLGIYTVLTYRNNYNNTLNTFSASGRRAICTKTISDFMERLNMTHLIDIYFDEQLADDLKQNSKVPVLVVSLFFYLSAPA